MKTMRAMDVPAAPSGASFLLLLLLLLAGAAPVRAQDEPPDEPPEPPAAIPEGAEVLALRGAIVHVPDGPPIPRGTVLIAAGRIVAVGPEADVQIPEGATRLFLAGQHLYPGLIDADTVLGLTEIGAVKATNDTDEVGRVNPNLRAELAVNPDSELFPVARTGGVLLAVTAPRTGIVSGLAALIDTAGWTYEDMTVKAPLWLHVRWPSMGLDRTANARKKLDEQVKEREERLALLDRMLDDARAYWRAREAPGARRPELDPKWDALREVVERRIPVAIEADGPQEIRAALDWGHRQVLRVIIVGGAEAWRLADALATADVPVILGPTQSLPTRDDDPYDSAYRNAALLHQAGVRFCFSTGGNAFASANSRNLRLHAATAVAHGLHADVAVRALTTGAAEILGVDDRVGSIAPGLQATLFACDGELLETRTTLTAAWIAGKQVELVDRQLELFERYRDRPRRD